MRAAMKFAFDHFKIVVESGAAVGLAAVLRQKIDIEGVTIAVIATVSLKWLLDEESVEAVMPRISESPR